jgi:transposase
MMQFPISDLMDEQACHDFLMRVLHPNGLMCPCGHKLPPTQAPHDRHRAPIMDYRCRECGAVYNLFTGTLWSKSRMSCSMIVLIMRGIAQGVPTKHLAAELGIDRCHLGDRRHKIQDLLADQLSPLGFLPDEVVEVDELYQNAGEKGHKHEDVHDPPRQRANQTRGHGTWETDRVPILGIVGRASGRIRLCLVQHSTRDELEPLVSTFTQADATVNTDEWGAYDRLDETGRTRQTVCHSQREWARDDDGDGIREVHINTMEGIWTGLRNFLRPFRGVSKKFLDGYLAVFEWAHNLKRVTADFLLAMLIPFTSVPS